jgi:hypothetical protein
MAESVGRCLVKVPLGPSVSSGLNCVLMRRELGPLLDFSVLVVRERGRPVWLAAADTHDGSDAEQALGCVWRVRISSWSSAF